MEKCTTLMIWSFLSILAFCIRLNEAVYQCSDCHNTTLGTESQNITFGPSNEYYCNCDWTIPTNLSKDDNVVVALLLQNVSISTTRLDCTGEIRFPSRSGYECKFPPNYCLAFATGSSKCNINKIREIIPVANHTCNSTIPWSKAGGRPYRISYYAGNYAGHTKSFTIQYLVIDCRNSTTTSEPTTAINYATRTTTTTGHFTTRSSPDMMTKKGNMTEEYPKGTLSDQPTTGSAQQDQGMTSSTTIIIIAVVSVLGLVLIVGAVFLIKRYSINNKQEKPQQRRSIVIRGSQQDDRTVRERPTYENYKPTSDESGYEVPIPLNNRNVAEMENRQYENVSRGGEYDYDN